MATYEDFQRAQDDGKVHEFSPHKPNLGTIRGKVVGRTATVLATSAGGTTKAWKIQDDQGNSYEVLSEDYDID